MTGEAANNLDAAQESEVLNQTEFLAELKALPSVGEIVGFLVKHFGQLKPPLDSKTHRRFFSGPAAHLITPETKGAILKDIAEWIVSEGLLPDTFEQHGFPTSQVVQAVLDLHATEWEAWRSILYPFSATGARCNKELFWAPYIRLGTIDLALRIAAGLSLAKTPKAHSRALRWLNANRPGEFIKTLMRDAGNLTRAKFAEDMDVRRHTIDSWLDEDARPRDRALREAASLLAFRSDGVQTHEIEMDLRQLYLLNDVYILLREYAGVDIAQQATERLFRYIELAFDYLIAEMIRTARTDGSVSILFLGSRSPSAGPVLTALSRKESAEDWRIALRFAGGDWFNLILKSNIQSLVSDLVAVSRQNEWPSEGLEGDRLKSSMLLKASLESYKGGILKAVSTATDTRPPTESMIEEEIRESIALLDRAIQFRPDDPEFQSLLGEIKLMQGESLNDNVLIQEALNAFWTASKLDPSSLRPWIGIAEALMRFGRSQDALDHLLSVDEKRNPLTAEYHLTLAEAQHSLGLYKDWERSMNVALELEPNEPALAYRATMLAAEQGNKRLVKKYGRSASRLGVPEGSIKSLELQAKRIHAEGKRK